MAFRMKPKDTDDEDKSACSFRARPARCITGRKRGPSKRRVQDITLKWISDLDAALNEAGIKRKWADVLIAALKARQLLEDSESKSRPVAPVPNPDEVRPRPVQGGHTDPQCVPLDDSDPETKQYGWFTEFSHKWAAGVLREADPNLNPQDPAPDWVRAFEAHLVSQALGRGQHDLMLAVFIARDRRVPKDPKPKSITFVLEPVLPPIKVGSLTGVFINMLPLRPKPEGLQLWKDPGPGFDCQICRGHAAERGSIDQICRLCRELDDLDSDTEVHGFLTDYNRQFAAELLQEIAEQGGNADVLVQRYPRLFPDKSKKR